jgi:hypothetical protein
MAVVSIFKSGLKKPGQIADGANIRERKYHYQPGCVVDGKYDWSEAVFLSPILTYAAHPRYAGKIHSKQGTGQWCVLIHAYVRPNTFSTYPSTISETYATNEESKEPEEMRVEPGEEEETVNGDESVEMMRIS